MLGSIFLDSTPPFTSSEYWNGVFQNAIGCSIGSGIAIAISFYIYWLTIRENNKTLRIEKKIKEENQLKAFSLLLSKAIDDVNDQLKGLKTFNEEIKGKPHDFPRFVCKPNITLKRIIDQITIEKTGLTYVTFFNKSTSSNEFLAILNIVDCLFEEISNLSKSIDIARNQISDMRMGISDSHNNIIDKIMEYPANKDYLKVIAEDLSKIVLDFKATEDNFIDIHKVNDGFFTPLDICLKDAIKANQNEPSLLNLFTHNNHAIWSYKALISQYDYFEKAFSEMYEVIDVYLEGLKKFSSTILKSKLTPDLVTEM
jgi:hypothetical protein